MEADQEKETTKPVPVVRELSPVLANLSEDPPYVQRFAQITNGLIGKQGGTPIEEPYVEEVRRGYQQPRPFIVVEIPYRDNNDQKEAGLRQLAKSLFENRRVREGLFFSLPPDQYGFSTVIHRVFAPQLYYAIYPEMTRQSRPGNPHQKEGLFLKGKKEIPVAGLWKVDAEKILSSHPKEGILEIHDLGSLSEVELAYGTVIASLIMAGKIDLSSAQRMEETLPQRREIFWCIYKEMLRDMTPVTERDDIYGLDSQIDDIDANLFAPLISKKGKPMNTLLVGAPGVGKSFVGRFFATNKDGVLTVPLPIKKVFEQDDHKRLVFETMVIPRLLRIRNNLGFPSVILIDDIEALLETTIYAGPRGVKQDVIDPERRSYALNLLERLDDTFGVYILGTLNHPDVEAAFLRRFNPVYFPLPSGEQRGSMLEKIIDRGPLAQEDYQDMLGLLEGGTNGLNYSCISLIPEYLKNILLSKTDTSSANSYKEALKQALQKARERAATDKLSEFDKAAQRMTGRRVIEDEVAQE